MLDLLLIANPAAGKGKTRRYLPSVQSYLRRERFSVQTVLTKGPGDATRIASRAREMGVGCLVVCGGDGTVGETAAGLRGSSIPLCIVPTGTGNDLARTLQIPRDVRRLTALLKTGRATSIDLALSPERVFASSAAVGFPAEVIAHTNKRSQSRLPGSWVILTSVLQTLRHLRTYTFKVTVDSDTFQERGIGVFILNSRYTGVGMLMAPEAEVADGLIDVIFLGDVNRRQLLSTLPRAYVGRHLDHPAVLAFQGRKVRVEVEDTAPPPPVMFDGDVCGSVSLAAEVHDKALRVLVPEKSTRAEKASQPATA